MISVHLIQRAFELQDTERLFRLVNQNGLDLPLPLQIRLLAGPVAPLALALSRLMDLTYGHTPLGRDMAAAILAHQQAQGAFEAGGEPDPLATAAAAAAMGRLMRESAVPWPELATARQRALAALGELQGDDSLFCCPHDRTQADRALIAAFILVLLGDDADFRQAVRYADLLTWFDEHARRLEPATHKLYRLASLGRAARTAHQPAAAA